jgi:hypothetical protein
MHRYAEWSLSEVRNEDDWRKALEKSLDDHLRPGFLLEEVDDPAPAELDRYLPPDFPFPPDFTLDDMYPALKSTYFPPNFSFHFYPEQEDDTPSLLSLHASLLLKEELRTEPLVLQTSGVSYEGERTEDYCPASYISDCNRSADISELQYDLWLKRLQVRFKFDHVAQPRPVIHYAPGSLPCLVRNALDWHECLRKIQSSTSNVAVFALCW